VTEEPIPHWPGRLFALADHQVYLRSVAWDPPHSDSSETEYPGQEYPEPDGRTRARAKPRRSVEPALCVHGLEGSSRNWTDLMDLLRPALACDAVDLPGHGDSPPRPDNNYGITALAQTLAQTIERRGRGPVHLMGNSYGGAVCVRLAATRPELIRSLTLISPALPDPRPRLDLARFPLMTIPGVGERLLRQMSQVPPENRVADVIATCYADPSRFPRSRFATEVAELTRRDTLGHAAATLVGCVRALTAETLRIARWSAWRDAARIEAPALVIYGREDRLVDPRNAGRAAHAFRNGRIVVMPRTGHVAHMEHPEAVAAEISQLLERAAPAPARAREFPLTRTG
jgi:pimeloyl-ACP methyl ester carboxylesterase